MPPAHEPPPIFLAPTPGAAGAARRRVADVCSSWPADRVQIAVLLTSELVSNAVRHAGGGIRLLIRCDSHGLRVEIRDSNAALPPQHPVMPAPTPTAPGHRALEGGRGLSIVSALATDWGARPEPDGKTVWFELSATPA